MVEVGIATVTAVGTIAAPAALTSSYTSDNAEINLSQAFGGVTNLQAYLVGWNLKSKDTAGYNPAVKIASIVLVNSATTMRIGMQCLYTQMVTITYGYVAASIAGTLNKI